MVGSRGCHAESYASGRQGVIARPVRAFETGERTLVPGTTFSMRQSAVNVLPASTHTYGACQAVHKALGTNHYAASGPGRPPRAGRFRPPGTIARAAADRLLRRALRGRRERNARLLLPRYAAHCGTLRHKTVKKGMPTQPGKRKRLHKERGVLAAAPPNNDHEDVRLPKAVRNGKNGSSRPAGKEQLCSLFLATRRFGPPGLNLATSYSIRSGTTGPNLEVGTREAASCIPRRQSDASPRPLPRMWPPAWCARRDAQRLALRRRPPSSVGALTSRAQHRMGGDPQATPRGEPTVLGSPTHAQIKLAQVGRTLSAVRSLERRIYAREPHGLTGTSSAIEGLALGGLCPEERNA
ncbi:hypothetical protein MRX96_047046 [Rhipicephalus microplus]